MIQMSTSPKVLKNGTSLLAKATPGNLFSASIVAGAAAGFLIAYDSGVAPASGETLVPARLLGVAPVLANGFANLGGNYSYDKASSGVTLLFSTNIDTYTPPASVALFMRASVV